MQELWLYKHPPIPKRLSDCPFAQFQASHDGLLQSIDMQLQKALRHQALICMTKIVSGEAPGFAMVLDGASLRQQPSA